MDPTEIRFGSENGDYVFIIIDEVADDPYPEYRGVWMTASVRTGSFQARKDVSAYFREFETFARDLAALHASVEGSAAFTPQDGRIALTLAGDSLGHVSVRGFLAQDAAQIGSVLRFSLDIDQTFLPSIVTSLDAFVAAYAMPPKARRS